LKMKAMRVFRFGRHIAKVPRLYTARYYDYPMCESEAAHVSITNQHTIPPKYFDSKNIIPAQHLEGEMIPLTEDEVVAVTSLHEAGSRLPKDKAGKTSALAAKPQHMETDREIECLLQTQNNLVHIKKVEDIESDSLNEFVSFDNEGEPHASAKIDTRVIKDEAIEDLTCIAIHFFSCESNMEENDGKEGDFEDEGKDLSLHLINGIQCSHASVDSVLEEGVEIIACPRNEDESIEMYPSSVGTEVESSDDDPSCVSRSLSSLYKSSDCVFVSFCR